MTTSALWQILQKTCLDPERQSCSVSAIVQYFDSSVLSDISFAILHTLDKLYNFHASPYNMQARCAYKHPPGDANCCQTCTILYNV